MECAPDVRARLEQIQAEVERRIPSAIRCVGYGMPAFRGTRVFFYFASFKKHIGIYPPVKDDSALITETVEYRGPKGTLSFPHAERLPTNLIGRVAEALARQHGVS
jgi:uncharacterized protein YdhG (YjbR/CyaY superfamily)